MTLVLNSRATSMSDQCCEAPRKAVSKGDGNVCPTAVVSTNVGALHMAASGRVLHAFMNEWEKRAIQREK